MDNEDSHKDESVSSTKEQIDKHVENQQKPDETCNYIAAPLIDSEMYKMCTHKENKSRNKLNSDEYCSKEYQKFNNHMSQPTAKLFSQNSRNGLYQNRFERFSNRKSLNKFGDNRMEFENETNSTIDGSCSETNLGTLKTNNRYDYQYNYYGNRFGSYNRNIDRNSDRKNDSYNYNSQRNYSAYSQSRGLHTSYNNYQRGHNFNSYVSNNSNLDMNKCGVRDISRRMSFNQMNSYDSNRNNYNSFNDSFNDNARENLSIENTENESDEEVTFLSNDNINFRNTLEPRQNAHGQDNGDGQDNVDDQDNVDAQDNVDGQENFKISMDLKHTINVEHDASLIDEIEGYKEMHKTNLKDYMLNKCDTNDTNESDSGAAEALPSSLTPDTQKNWLQNRTRLQSFNISCVLYSKSKTCIRSYKDFGETNFFNTNECECVKVSPIKVRIPEILNPISFLQTLPSI